MTSTPTAKRLVLAAILLLGGCVQRAITVNSTPSGALVYLNDTEVGRTPVTVPFTFYGTYEVRLEKEGYETINTKQKANAPWWEAPGPDLLAELLPGVHRVDLNWAYTMTENKPVDEPSLIERARQLRNRTK